MLGQLVAALPVSDREGCILKRPECDREGERYRQRERQGKDFGSKDQNGQPRHSSS